MADLESLWNETLVALEGQIPKPHIDNWVAPLRPIRLDGNTLILGAGSELHKSYVSKNCQGRIEAALGVVSTQPMSVRFELTHAPQPVIPAPAPVRTAVRQPSLGEDSGIPLNPKYIFESFVVGNSNRFAHAAAQGVAEKLGASHNPLVLYGGVGLGKTHLLHAIGNFIRGLHPQKRVVYTTSEKFTNDMIKSLKDQHMSEFRRKYRNMDLLLIDDIQFLQGKESIQEEFFHTFNDLQSVQHQIVATSDTHPKDIKVEDRLRSRFQGGLVADLQPPDIETRTAILQKKAEFDHLLVPEEVLAVIASAVQSNIRELEGALNRVIAFAVMVGQPLSAELALETLRDLLPVQKQPQTASRIQSAVANYFSIEATALSERTRTDAIAYPRQIAMFLCRELLGSSYMAIGDQFGGRDHSTALHSVEKIRRMQEGDPQTKLHLSEIKRALSS
jgi:chromosomal replication initiator protein